jgi:hypothetical protein
MRADLVEASLSVLNPILRAWTEVEPVDFPNYQSGTWEPEAADGLIAKDGRSWLQSILKKDQEGNRSKDSVEPTKKWVETWLNLRMTETDDPSPKWRRVILPGRWMRPRGVRCMMDSWLVFQPGLTGCRNVEIRIIR